MSVKIGLISDVHAAPGPLGEALEVFAGEGVETILCAGDIAGYGRKLGPTVELLVSSGCQSIMGNHDLWWLSRDDFESRSPTAEYLRNLPLSFDLEMEGVRLHMVHASPPESLMDGIKLLDEEGEMLTSQREFWTESLDVYSWDILVVGHTHQVFAERLGAMLVVNPGSTLFNHTCAVLSLPEMEVRFIPLGDKEPELTWNWAGGFPSKLVRDKR